MKSRTVVVMVAVLVLGAAAGCEDDEHFPPGEGGGPSGGGGSNQNDAGGGGADAGTSDASTGDAGAQLAGELCDVVDVRRPLLCPDAVNLSGIEVRAVAEDVTDETEADGDFSLDVERESDLLLEVSSADDTTRLALVRLDLWFEGALRVPRVDKDDWDDLIENAIGTNEPSGTASIALYVVDLDGIPIPDVVVEVVDSGGSQVYYDGGSPEEWILIGDTGPLGAALIVQVPVADGAVTVTVGTNLVVIPVDEDHLTFARVRV